MKRFLSLFLGIVLILSSFSLIAGASTAQSENNTYGEHKSGDFYYNVLNDKTAEITYYTGNNSILTIPAKIDEKQVSLFNGKIFNEDYKKTVEEIIFENGIKTVSTFGDCPNLKKVTLPKSMTKLSDAFYNCPLLDTVIGGENVVNCGGITFEDTPFYKNSIAPKNGLFYFGKCLIAMNKNYSGALKIKGNTKFIGFEIFSDCKNLTSVYIPASVQNFGAPRSGFCNFWNCPKLEKITVSKDNRYFSSVNGILFNKKQTVLYRYPSAKSGKTYTIPKKVKEIAEAAFEGSKYLTTVNFDKTPKIQIDGYAFFNCKSIKSMTIPKKATLCSWLPNMGLYNNGEKEDEEYGLIAKKSDKGFVLRGYRSNSDVSNYAEEYLSSSQYVTFCKNNKAHKLETVKPQKSTYFSKGHSGYKRCKVCGEITTYYNEFSMRFLNTPQIKVAGGKGVIKVTYNAVKNATGFQILCVDQNGKSVKKTFTENKTKTVKLSGIAKGEYRVYARAFIKSGKQVAYSSWSSRYNVTVK